jgi:hypothetical protein
MDATELVQPGSLLAAAAAAVTLTLLQAPAICNRKHNLEKRKSAHYSFKNIKRMGRHVTKIDVHYLPAPKVTAMASLSNMAGGLCLKAFIRRWRPPPPPPPPSFRFGCCCFRRICSTGKTLRLFLGNLERACCI